MALKAFYESQAEIPEQFAEHYSEQNGRWMLTLEGGEAVAGSALKTALESERKAREKAARELKELQAKIQQFETQPAPQQSDTAGDIQKQLAAQAKAFDEQMKQLRQVVEQEQQARKTAEERLWQTRLEEGISRYASPLVHEGAIDDVLSRSRGYFKPDETGNPVPYDGDSVLYGIKDPTKPMPIEEFVAERVLKSAKHLLRPSSGTGTQGSTGNAAGGAVSITRDEARNASVYAEAKARAEKAGRPLVIVPTAA